jgi:hypothetical protein
MTFFCSALSPTSYLKSLQKSSNAAMMSFAMTAAQCMYMSYVHDSTLLWGLFDALTTSHNVLSVCTRAFAKIDDDATRNVFDMLYGTP